jgi:hypothetical protein
VTDDPGDDDPAETMIADDGDATALRHLPAPALPDALGDPPAPVAVGRIMTAWLRDPAGYGTAGKGVASGLASLRVAASVAAGIDTGAMRVLGSAGAGMAHSAALSSIARSSSADLLASIGVNATAFSAVNATFGNAANKTAYDFLANTASSSALAAIAAGLASNLRSTQADNLARIGANSWAGNKAAWSLDAGRGMSDWLASINPVGLLPSIVPAYDRAARRLLSDLGIGVRGDDESLPFAPTDDDRPYLIIAQAAPEVAQAIDRAADAAALPFWRQPQVRNSLAALVFVILMTLRASGVEIPPPWSNIVDVLTGAAGYSARDVIPLFRRNSLKGDEAP